MFRCFAYTQEPIKTLYFLLGGSIILISKGIFDLPALSFSNHSLSSSFSSLVEKPGNIEVPPDVSTDWYSSFLQSTGHCEIDSVIISPTPGASKSILAGLKMISGASNLSLSRVI